jgi:hypothetical protein
MAGVAGGVALFLAFTGPAAAQDGGGLYEPFPQPAGPSVSRDFIEELRPPGPRLASALSPDELERGRRVPGSGLAATPAPQPSGRAEPGSFSTAALGWLGVAALLAVAVAATRRLTPA